MANVSQVKIPAGIYDIEDTVARRVANQSLQIINERVEEIDGLLENANKIVEVAEEPSSEYTQVLVDPEEIILEYEVVDEAVVDEAVSDWLDDHPEATTTVQDGSLTYEKLVTGTLGFVTPEMFGARADGLTDDSSALKNAIQYAVSNGTELRLGKGTYNIETHSVNNFNIHITGKCRIVGEGRDITVIKTGGNNAGLAHILDLDNADNVYISDLTIDGGINANAPAYTNNIYCHGIRINSCDDVTVKRVAIRNVSGYGIAIVAGSTKHFHVSDVIVENCGRDGIDAKNFDDTNGDFEFNDIYVSNIGTRNITGVTGGDLCCLDIRCFGANVNNCYFENLANASSGLRARITTQEQGTGGEYNNFNNIVVKGASGNTGEGIAINAVAANVNNFTIDRMGVGVRVTSDFTKLSNGNITNTANGGIRLDADGLEVNNCYLSNCGVTNTISMLDLRKGNSFFTNCVFGDCDTVSGCYDDTVGIYFTACYLKGTPATRFAAGSLANRTAKNHVNSTCVNITIS